MSRIFLLSPASTVGKRAELLFNEKAEFELARRIRAAEGAPLGDVFSFLSGLYFRGKLAYARAFGSARGSLPSAFVITPSRGLLPPEHIVALPLLREFSRTAIDLDEPAYRAPFEEAARSLAARLDRDAEVVLLGSIATGKYVEPLLEILGERLLFPSAFVGRGDMSRGGLMLRAVTEGRELEYRRVAEGSRRGARPEKLAPIRKPKRG